MLKLFWKILPFVVLALYFGSLFYKVILHNWWPFPGDVLVSYFFPWDSSGWVGWSPGIFHKEAIASDVFRLYIPWKNLGSEMIRSGQLPLWNPYNFAGTPLLANFQSSFFYPFGFIFYFLPTFPAWLFYIFLQPILGFFGMYLYLRLITKSKFSAVFGAVGFISTGFMLTWFDWGLVGHAAIWIGWLLFIIHKLFWDKRKTFKYLLPGAVSMAILAGYPQITMLIFLTVILYALISIVNLKEKRLSGIIMLFGLFSLGALVTLIQIIPSLELSMFSARNTGSSEIISSFSLPLPAFITIFAPDFFGNIAVNNFWGVHHYQEHLMYFGISILPFVLIAILNFKKSIFIKFFLFLAFFSVIFVLPTPLINLLGMIPVFSSGIPTRTLFLFETSMVILSAIGLDLLILKKIKRKQILIVTASLLLIYAGFWITLIFIGKYSSLITLEHLAVAKRNLLLPTAFMISSLFILIIFRFSRIKRELALGILVLLVIFEAGYFFNKFSPFAPPNYFFPEHPLFNDLKKMAKIDRVWGFKTGHIATNYDTYYRFQTTDGYDSLYISRYGEFLSSIRTGKYVGNLQRADANLPQEYSENLLKITKLMGVSYYSHRFTREQKKTDPMWTKFIKKIEVIKDDSWPISKDPKTSPRAFLAGDYLTLLTKEEIINKVFDKKTDLSKTLILENKLKLSLDKATGSASFLEYLPNLVSIKTQSKGDNLLFLSDNYYPGWNVYVDGKKSEIYRADFTFRAVYIPKGKHIAVFKYEPVSIKIGALITLISLGVYLVWVGRYLFSRKKK